MSTVALVDLEAACALYGRDTLPRPLARSRPVGSVWLARRDVAPIAERLADGDLRDVRTWVSALGQAEVTVDCRVRFSDEATADIRVHALRAGAAGFVAAQRRDDAGMDVIDIYEVAPSGLGAVIAESVGLVGAGTRVRIAVAGGGGGLPAPPAAVDEYDDFGFLIPSAEPRDTALDVVDGAGVVAVAALKSWHDPECRRDGDANRHILQWVQIDGDGDYLYAAGGVGYAEPMDADLLRRCIEELVAG